MIIELNKILNKNDANEVQHMRTQLELHGWCFVRLPEELIPKSNLITDLTNFFEDKVSKNKYSSRSQIYGYSKVDHKEGIKLLTGNYFKDLVRKQLVPRQGHLVESLNYLSQAFDAISKRLIEILDEQCVFQEKPSIRTLIERADLPLKDEHFGMLDIVSYFNEKSGVHAPDDASSVNDVNCVEHYDPGLLSISILSTLQGLQLKDRLTNQWIDGPLDANIGVIWLGEIASRITNNRLKPGIHRVIYPDVSKRRLTIWYEVCTTEQLESLSGKKKTEPMPEGTVVFDGLPTTKPINVLPGENRLDFLKRIEMSRGLSVSKAGPPRYIPTKHDFSFSSN